MLETTCVETVHGDTPGTMRETACAETEDMERHQSQCLIQLVHRPWKEKH